MAENKEEVQIKPQPATATTGTTTTTSSSNRGKKGMAPFASLEDLSDDSPPDDKMRLTLPGIREDPSPTRTGITPRIDISRASSSSHHDDSSPERELFSGSANGGAKIGLGFTEEMAVELRNSTEELDFQDPEEETKSRRKKLHQQHAVTKHELDAEAEKTANERKDSACSEGGLLFIGGRTSRLSSIGSAGSAASHVSVGSAVSGHSHLSAVSHLSGQSRLSAASNASGSRCSSPHKMLLETSFCGPKPIPTVSLEAEYPPTESVEAALLARKTDITGAVLPNDDSIKIPTSRKSSVASSKGTKSNTLEVTRLKARSSSERLTNPRTHHVQARSSSERGNLKSRIKIEENEFVKIIPLHGSLDESDDAPVETAQSDKTRGDSSSTYTPEHGIYIPLKGPLVDPVNQESTPKKPEGKSKKVEIQESDLVRFISLHGEDDEDIQKSKTSPSSSTSGRNGQNVQFKPWPNEYAQYSQKDRISKKPVTPRSISAHDSKSKSKPSTLDVQTTKTGGGRPTTQSMTCLPRDESRTPSPATSFTKGALFRRSSDSSGSSKKSANTSGSSDSKTKKDTKNKSMFTSLFKKNIKDNPAQQKVAQDNKPSAIDPKFTNVEFKFKQEEADTIIIPLHSPDGTTKPSLLNEEDAITADTAGDYDEKLSKMSHSSREFAKQESDVLRTMKALENKNIIVVDVINADTAVCYEAVIETPRAITSIPCRSPETIGKPQEKHQVKEKKVERTSLTTQPLELETLESEPRVRVASRRSSRTSALGFDVYGFGIEADERPTDQVKQDDEVKKKEDAPVKSEPSVVKSSEEAPSDVPIEAEDKRISLETGSVKSQASFKDESEEKRSSESEMEVASVEERSGWEEERKGLFNQAESVEEELPYVPTTLPQERSVAVPIVPVKQRMSEVRTCPVDRPRSTTPIHPSNLEEYAASHDNSRRPSTKTDKMQIILPRTDSIGKSRSPGKAMPWSKWAEECLQSPKEIRRADKTNSPTSRISSSSPPPPLPPRSTVATASVPPPPPPPLSSSSSSSSTPQTAANNSQSWVIFDEPHEQERRPVRRITTLPVRHVQTAAPSQATLVYSYVNPEECSCECHEVVGKVNSSSNRKCSSNQSDSCSGPSRTDKEKRHKS